MNINSLSDMEKVKKLIQETMNQGVREELQDYASETQRTVPVVTGQLRDSFKVKVNNTNQFNSGIVSPFKMKQGINEFELSYGAIYAEYVHENAKEPSRRGYFLNPYNNWINGLEDRLQARLDKL